LKDLLRLLKKLEKTSKLSNKINESIKKIKLDLEFYSDLFWDDFSFNDDLSI